VKSSPVLRSTPEELEAAKRLLRANDYVVVPRDRYLRLGGDKSVSRLMLEHLGPEELPRFAEYSDANVARAMGQEMLRKGAITKTEMPDAEWHHRVWRYEAAVILPRADDDTR
jgi:hypothetical protein